MSDDITIPPEALEAAARAALSAIMFEVEPDARANQLTNDEYRSIARAACLAMLRAWPGMCHAHNENGVNVEWAKWYALPWHRANASEGIILPFSENTDAEG